LEHWQQTDPNLNRVEIIKLQRLTEVSQIELGFPHNFLSNDTIRDRLFGGTFDAIDRSRSIATHT
jgi:hypothetical protein